MDDVEVLVVVVAVVALIFRKMVRRGFCVMWDDRFSSFIVDSMRCSPVPSSCRFILLLLCMCFCNECINRWSDFGRLWILMLLVVVVSSVRLAFVVSYLVLSAVVPSVVSGLVLSSRLSFVSPLLDELYSGSFFKLNRELIGLCCCGGGLCSG